MITYQWAPRGGWPAEPERAELPPRRCLGDLMTGAAVGCVVLFAALLALSVMM